MRALAIKSTLCIFRASVIQIGNSTFPTGLHLCHTFELWILLLEFAVAEVRDTGYMA